MVKVQAHMDLTAQVCVHKPNIHALIKISGDLLSCLDESVCVCVWSVLTLGICISKVVINHEVVRFADIGFFSTQKMYAAF